MLVIGLDGATYDVLQPLVERGVMPNLGAFMRRAGLAQLHSTEPAVTPTAWTTFLCGCDPSRHGIWDYRYFDRHTGEVRLNHAGRVSVPNLFDAVSQAGGEVVSLNLPMTYPVGTNVQGLIVGGLDSPSLETVLAPYPAFAERLRRSGAHYHLKTIWKRRPESFEELSAGVAATGDVFRGRVTAARIADEMHDWQLMVVQFQTLDSLQHRLWHLLGLPGMAGGPPAWIERAQHALRTLDECLGNLFELAARRGAGVAIVSDHGFGSFREKISLPELLRRADLLCPANRWQRTGFRFSRWSWKLRRWAYRRRSPGGSTATVSRPSAALLPIDWRRSRAIALHGNLGGLIYLNTPERFGVGPVQGPRRYEETAAEVVAAFRAARHPETGEPLFEDVYAVAQRHACDPLVGDLPDVVAIPAGGFHTRPKLDRWGRLMRSDRSLTGTHRREGVFMLHARGVVAGQHHAGELREVAPLLLQILGVPRPATMQSSGLAKLLTGVRSQAIALNLPPTCVDGHGLNRADQQAVEQRLRELGYIE